MRAKPTPTLRRGLMWVACMASVVGSTGCASWKTAEGSPYQVFADERPGKVRLTTSDGTLTVLERPRILGEVVAGFDNECIERFGRLSNQCPEVGFAVFDISVFEVQRRGALAIVLPAVGGLGLAWLLANR